MSVPNKIVHVKDLIAKAYIISDNWSFVPDSIDSRHLEEILMCYMEYNSDVDDIFADETITDDEHLVKILDARFKCKNNVTKLFKSWIDTEIIDIYTSFKVMKKSVTFTPIVSLLKNISSKLSAFSSANSRIKDDMLHKHNHAFWEFYYNTIGSDYESYENYAKQVIIDKFNS
jgi:hypothetical protein